MRKVKIKEKDNDINTELERQIKQMPNKRFAGLFPLKMWVYSMADRGKENSFKWWLKNKLGEPLVLLDTAKCLESQRRMVSFLNSKGFFEAEVLLDIKSGKRKSKVVYRPKKGEPFYINNIRYETEFYSINKKLEAILKETKLLPGTRYDVALFEKERARIVKELKNSGVFQFYKDLIYFELDTSIGSKKMDVLVKMESIENKKYLDQYRIKEVFVHPNYSFELMDSSIQMDTLSIQGIKVITNNTKEFNWSQIERKIMFHPEQKFYYSKYYEITHKNLADLGIFNYIDILFEEVNTDSTFRYLNCHIHLKSAKKKEMGVELEVNSGTGIQEGQALGTAVKFSYRNKNIFGGAEALNFNVHGGLETQLGQQTQQLFNTFNMKAQIGLEMPRIIGPVKQDWFAKNYSPKTLINLSYDYQYRPEYLSLMTSNISFGYEWNEGNNKQHFLTPLVLNYLQAEYEGDLLTLANQNPQIKNALQDQWIVGSKYIFVHNTQFDRPNRDFGYFKFSLDFSGNGLWAYSKLSGVDDIKIFGVDYSQYLKTDLDLRRYFNFKRGRLIIARLNIGAAYAYGNSDVIPYIKQFYLGGANSMRAWRARSLGPGAYYDSLAYANNRIIDQTGDVKLEANLEGRFNFSQIVKGALFVDIGNIWTIKDDPYRPSSIIKRDLAALWDDIAICWGFGLRFDFSFFVIRTDLGVKFKDPIYDKHFNSGASFNDAINTYDFWNVNFAIGYPF